MFPDSDDPVAISVVIAVYNDWGPLAKCLRSLADQVDAPRFEVIVVDDGSKADGGHSLQGWVSSLDLQLHRLTHRGVSAARNYGLKMGRGQAALFVDADCVLESNCLEVLHERLRAYPAAGAFQLRIRGDCSSLVGRAEELRLATIQQERLLSNGRIRWLVTGGFAIRLQREEARFDLFDIRAVRAEDTLLLAELALKDDWPNYVGGATVIHAIPLSPIKYVLKEFRSSYLESNVYRLIKTKGIEVRSSNLNRWRRLKSMWSMSHGDSIGALALVLLLSWNVMRMLGRLTYRLAGHEKGEGGLS